MKISGNVLLRIFSYMSLAISFLPIADYYCPWYITMIPALVVLGLCLYIDSGVRRLCIAALCIITLAAMLLWFTKRQDNITNFLANFFITMLPVLLTIQLSKAISDPTFFRDYLRAVTLFIAVTCITTMIGHIQYPMASRELASGTAIYDTERYLKINIGGYDFIYTLVLLIPVFFLQAQKEEGFWKFLYIAALVLSVFCVYSSQYTIALVCVVIAFLIMWVIRNPKAGLFASIAFLLLFLLGGLNLLAQPFYWLSEHIGQSYIADRFLQVGQLLSGQVISTETTDARLLHYWGQLITFAKQPIFGSNWLAFHKDAISGHTQILDMLGSSGIIGTTLFVLLMRKLFCVALNPTGSSICPEVKAVWFLGTLIAILNPIFFPAIMIAAFPCCMCAAQAEPQ